MFIFISYRNKVNFKFHVDALKSIFIRSIPKHSCWEKYKRKRIIYMEKRDKPKRGPVYGW